jgi:hypothetical protein
VPSICTVGIVSANTQQMDSRQHLVSTTSFLPEKLNPNYPRLRCLGSFIPILSPKVCQGPDSSGAYCHVSRDRRILRQDDIQAKSVGGWRLSPRTVGTCHCSDFCIICNHRVRPFLPRMNSALSSVSPAGCKTSLAVASARYIAYLNLVSGSPVTILQRIVD